MLYLTSSHWQTVMTVIHPNLGFGTTRGNVPSNAIVYLGGTDHAYSRYFFERNKQTCLVIALSPWFSCNYDFITEEENNERKAAFEQIMQTLGTLLQTFDFKRSNVGYLITKKNGIHVLEQRYRSLKRIAHSTWAPLVTLKELTLNRFFCGAWNRRGALYQGRQVDLFLALDNQDIDRLDHIMHIYTLLADLDLTYQVLAHLVDGSGSVIGIVTEPQNGREIEYRDKTLVYDAVSRLQSIGLIHTNLVDSCFIHVHNGKIRFSELLAIRPLDLSDAKKFQEFHWDDLSACLFHRLSRAPSLQPSLGWPYSLSNTGWLLPYTPSPERPMSNISATNRSRGRTHRGRPQPGEPSSHRSEGPI